MNVPLERRDDIVEAIRAMFGRAAAKCPTTTCSRPTYRAGPRSSPRPGARRRGSICPVGLKVVYAVPGVPYEMTDMFERSILPDLLARELAGGTTSVITSRVLRTWGASESALAEAVGERFEAARR